MMQISVNDLKPGMIVGTNVIGLCDMTYLTKGAKLTEKNIVRLKKLNISYIYIRENEDDDFLSEKLDYIEKSANRIFQIDYNKTLDLYKTVYDDFSSTHQFKLDEVKNVIDPLINKFTNDNNILKNLRQIKITDDYTYKHSINVFILSIMVGKWLRYSKNDLDNLAMAALFHDIGKNQIPDEILNKPSKLSVEEFEIMKTHPIHGYQAIKKITHINSNILYGIIQHHEKIDGTGYPFKLKNNEIHEFGKIISIVDIFDAMTSKRVYKSKESPFKVAELLADNRFGPLDPYICSIFLRGISDFYVGNIILLNTGEIGEVIMNNKNLPTKPLVRVNDKFIDLATNFDYEIIEVLG